jgi:hypothetical protein
VARATHATIGSKRAAHIENLGKQALERSGKYRVNKNDEENFQTAKDVDARNKSDHDIVLD